MNYSLTQDLQDRLNACVQSMIREHPDALVEWTELMLESVAKLREVEERLDAMWQEYRWSGDS